MCKSGNSIFFTCLETQRWREMDLFSQRCRSRGALTALGSQLLMQSLVEKWSGFPELKSMYASKQHTVRNKSGKSGLECGQLCLHVLAYPGNLKAIFQAVCIGSGKDAWERSP